MTAGTINDSTKTYSWTMNLFWVLVPLTIASGIWDIGGGEDIAFIGSIMVTLVYAIITVFRMLDKISSTFSWKKLIYHYGQGIIWAASMIFAWTESWVGYVYCILILINFCLLMMRRSKKT